MDQTTDKDFQYCVKVVLAEEGGYSNRSPAADPGGETNFGISKRAYPNLDIKNLTSEAAETIYYNDYWLVNHCDLVPMRLDLYFFNACVMSGGETALKVLQQTVGATPDGVWGPRTAASVANFPSVRHTEYLANYLAYLEGLKNWQANRNGWTRRLFKIASL